MSSIMSPLGLFFALAAPILYGIGNVAIAQKLSGVGNLAIIIVFNASVLTIALIVRHVFFRDNLMHNIPVGVTLVWMLGIALCMFVAEFMYIGAYQLKVSVYTITLATALIPAAASVTQFLWNGEVPNKYFVGAFALGLGMVVRTVLGEQERLATP